MTYLDDQVYEWLRHHLDDVHLSRSAARQPVGDVGADGVEEACGDLRRYGQQF